jgi:hypothetical protein
MSAFYGSMKGSAGEATRCGTKESGVGSHVRCYYYGVESRVKCAEDGTTMAIISVTSGSHGKRKSVDLSITNKGLEAILDGRAELKVVSTGGEGIKSRDAKFHPLKPVDREGL